VAINGIWQDEPTSGLGSGDTPIDGTKNADGTAFIRAERSAKGDGASTASATPPTTAMGAPAAAS